MGKYCFGIDVGGTSVKCGLFQTDGVLVEKWEIPTRKENSGEAILPDIAKTILDKIAERKLCLLYTSPSPRDGLLSRMPSSA